MTCQCHLNALVWAKLIKGDISAALQLVASTDFVTNANEEVMAVLRLMHPPTPGDTRIVPFPTSVLRYVRRPRQF